MSSDTRTPVQMLNETFAEVRKDSETFAKKFYETMLGEHPEVRPLFEKTNFTKQRVMLVKSLAFIVDNVENADKLVPAVANLGIRHLAYKTEPHHYSVVGSNLIKTLAWKLGDKFTPEVQKAWTDAYTTISNLMIKAANEYLEKSKVADIELGKKYEYE